MSILTALFLITLTSADPMPNLCSLVDNLKTVIFNETVYSPVPCPDVGFAVLPQAGAMRSQAGAFYPDTGAIELAPDLDLSDASGQSYLLHELVHAAQYANWAQDTARCPAVLEAEAYTVQSDFLRARSQGREAVMMRLLAGQLGTCPD
jgi:hypothetical protein